MSNQDKLKEIVRKIIKKEVEEASTSSATPGYQTPMAFSGGRKKDKKKKKKIANAAGYSVVKEGITTTGYSAFERILRYMMPYFKDLQKALKKRDDADVVNHIEDIYEYVLTMRGYLKNKKYTESVNEGSYEEKQIMNQLKGDDLALQIISSKGKTNFLKLTPEAAKKIAKIMKTMIPESINEGRYHDYRNDESMTPKQKIGRSMREIRDSLNNLDKLVKMNVRLKNELKVDSRSYWKNTHKALNKISERLVKLANKVGQLQ